MGRGIAQVAADAGLTVILADVRHEAVTGRYPFADMMQRKV
jgi:3-hydroxyacyl-CoA dehydrogenase